MKRVVIIGGGISGLSTAYFLQEEAKSKGVDLKYWLIEKNNRLGGNIITEKVDGFTVEGGPDNMLSQKPWALELCKKLGLGSSLLNTNKDGQTFILWKGKLNPLPEGFLLMIPTKISPLIFNNFFSIKGKLIMALDLIKPKGDPNKDESLSEFVRRRLGQEALDKIAEPLVAGVHAGNPDTMSVKSSYPRFIEMEQKYRSLIKAMMSAKKMAAQTSAKKEPEHTMFVTLKDGLAMLPQTIVKNLDKNSILTNTSVKNIAKSADDKTFIVNIEGSEPIEADDVILTTPAHISAKLLQHLDSKITKELEQIPYVSTATISLAYNKSDLKEPLKGFGFVIPKAEGRKIMAATYSSQKYAYRAPEDKTLIRCFVGGAKNEELVALPDEELISFAKADLADILGIKADPIFAKVFKWFNAMPQYIIGHSERIAFINERLKQHPGLHLAGTAFKTGIADSVHNGELVAKKII